MVFLNGPFSDLLILNNLTQDVPLSTHTHSWKYLRPYNHFLFSPQLTSILNHLWSLPYRVLVFIPNLLASSLFSPSDPSLPSTPCLYNYETVPRQTHRPSVGTFRPIGSLWCLCAITQALIFCIMGMAT